MIADIEPATCGGAEREAEGEEEVGSERGEAVASAFCTELLTHTIFEAMGNVNSVRCDGK